MSDAAEPLEPRSRRRRTRASYDARREEIIDLAAQLFARNGYAATGVAEISDAAGLGKGGLYYYIGSKEALLAEIHDRVMEPLLNEARVVADLEVSPLVRLCLLSELLMRVIRDRLDHVWVFLHEHRALHGELLDRFRLLRREFEDVVTALFEEGRSSGLFHYHDARLTSLAFLGMHNMTYQWFRPEGRYTTDELAVQYCRIFFDGVGGDVTAVEAEVRRSRHLVAT